MTAYFHGWRRKIGVTTLAMACAFTAIWVRGNSAEVKNMFAIPTTNGSQVLLLLTPNEIALRKLVIVRENGRTSTQLQRLWSVYHWSIVLPLTLLSAYLLFSKPQVTNPPESI